MGGGQGCGEVNLNYITTINPCITPTKIPVSISCSICLPMFSHYQGALYVPRPSIYPLYYLPTIKDPIPLFKGTKKVLVASTVQGRHNQLVLSKVHVAAIKLHIAWEVLRPNMMGLGFRV